MKDDGSIFDDPSSLAKNSAYLLLPKRIQENHNPMQPQAMMAVLMENGTALAYRLAGYFLLHMADEAALIALMFC